MANKGMANKGTIRLTMAQALTRFLIHQKIETEAGLQPIFAGVWAIFGHGNIAGLGEALYQTRDRLPVYRAHNEQAMAHAAIAFAKARRRRQMMACTTSIGPGATNMVTAAALAHVNRLPVLLLPGDVFANRRPDPVLQQLEAFTDPTLSANDCFRPVSRYWDRITRPEQIIDSLPAALSVLLDPAECGPVTLALCQDVQAEAYDYPTWLFEDRVHHIRAPMPDPREVEAAARLIARSKRPLLVVGGGLHYGEGFSVLTAFCERFGVPVAETQAGKGALPWDHPRHAGAIGVTGTSAANRLAQEADVIIAVGTRLQDFTTASRTLFAAPLVQINIARHDLVKHKALPVQGDAARGLQALGAALETVSGHGWRAAADWIAHAAALAAHWTDARDQAVALPDDPDRLPSDAEVIGAVNRWAADPALSRRPVVVCAAGGLPGELHRLWQADGPGSYHLEYGYSCMGYEIAGGLGVKLADPDRDVVVTVGDGSYLMMNSEIATSVAMGLKLTLVVLDNRGFGCINRLQQGCGGDRFNNLLPPEAPRIDFAAHAASLGAVARKVSSVAELEAALAESGRETRTTVLVIDTDAERTSGIGGEWWDVAVPDVSDHPGVAQAAERYRSRIRSRQP